MYMNANPNESKPEVFCFGGNVLKSRTNQCEYVYTLEEIPKLLEARLIIVEEWYDTSSDKNRSGKALIFDLRLKYRYTGPIVLVTGSKTDKRGKDCKEVLEDPLVHIRQLEELMFLLKNSKEVFLGIFDPHLSKEEQELLYFDLRQTLYRSESYLHEIRHKLLRSMDELGNGPTALEKARALLIEQKEVIKQIADTWQIMPSFSLGAVQEKFIRFMSIEDVRTLKNQVDIYFDEIENLIKSETGSRKDKEEVKIIYITQNESYANKLNDLFQEIAPNMRCIWAATDEEAIRIMERDHHNITTVLSGYRFLQADSNKIQALNGFIIISRIRKVFPHHYYAFLTDIGHLSDPTPLGMGAIDYYNRTQTLSRSTAGELHRLIEQARQHKNTMRQKTLPWPEQMSQSQNGKKWAELYFGEMKSNLNVTAMEKEIESETNRIVAGLLGGNSAASLNIPTVAGLLLNVKKPNFKEDLMPRLIIRRVILALLNYRGLGVKKFTDEAKRVEREKYVGKNASFAIVYLVLRGRNNVEDLNSKTISNFFTDGFIIHISKDYTQPQIACEQGIITSSENLWLVRNMPLFNS